MLRTNTEVRRKSTEKNDKPLIEDETLLEDDVDDTLVVETLENDAKIAEVAEKNNLEEISGQENKIVILLAEKLDDTTHESLDDSAKVAVDSVRQEVRDFLAEGNFRDKNIAELQKSLGSQEWQDGIPDTDIRKKLGQLLSIEIKGQIEEKIKEQKEKSDWRHPEKNPEHFKFDSKSVMDSGDTRKMTEEEARDALEEGEEIDAKRPSSDMASAEIAQEKWIRKSWEWVSDLPLVGKMVDTTGYAAGEIWSGVKESWSGVKEWWNETKWIGEGDTMGGKI